MSGRVLVIGAINVDLVVTAPKLPGPGETVLGGAFARHPGGKGANQAVAAARAGARVTMLGAVGDDAEGRLSLDALAEDRVDASAVRRVDAPTGVALIAVDSGGQNQIVVAPGANARLDADQIAGDLERLQPERGDVLLASLEVPMAAVSRAVVDAAARGMRVVVNPAPARDLPPELLAAGPILTPNGEELSSLTGLPDLEPAARSLIAVGGSAVVVTLGAAGATLVDSHGRRDLPGHGVARVADTTGAGDTFSGVLAAWLSLGQPLHGAVRAANAAAAMSVTAAGARDGMPAGPLIEAALANRS